MNCIKWYNLHLATRFFARFVCLSNAIRETNILIEFNKILKFKERKDIKAFHLRFIFT